MNITVTNQENCKKQLQLEIPAEVVKAEVDRKAATYARRITIPGFRPGHAPVNLVKKRFQKELRDEAVSELLPTSFTQAVKEKALKLVAEPNLDEMKVNDDDSISATFSLVTAPEFELSEYKHLSLTKHLHETTDAEVDKAIEMLREGRAELVPVTDRGAQTGDTLSIILSGKADLTYQPQDLSSTEAVAAVNTEEAAATASNQNAEASDEEAQEKTAANEASEADVKTAGEAVTREAVEALTEDDASAAATEEAITVEAEKTIEISEQNLDITLGAEGNLQTFDEVLTGAQAGEKKSVTIDYPKDYPDPNFANRRWHFDLEVTAVRAKELPTMDEEFLRGIDAEIKTVDELRAKIHANYEERNTQHSKDALRNAAIKQLIAANSFEVPESLVEKQTQQRFSETLNDLMRSGIDVRNLGLDWKAMMELQRDKAIDEVRSYFILERIIEAEKIEATDEELEREVALMATAMNQPLAALKARLTKEGGVDTIKEQIRHQKALDLIINSADIKEVVGEETEDATENTEEGSQAEG
ncbi:MAG: trigger factor [Acidobacteria bacterium]|nr:trigger factor [Acidobacteriota bacterium]